MSLLKSIANQFLNKGHLENRVFQIFLEIKIHITYSNSVSGRKFFS